MVTTLPPSCTVVMKSGKLNFLNPLGDFRLVTGLLLPNILKGPDVPNLCSIKYYSKSGNFCRRFYTAAKLVAILQNR